VAEARAAEVSVTAGDAALLSGLLAAADPPASRGRPPLAVHLEVETGLGRGGFGVEDAVDAARAIEEADGVSLGGLWTHLQAPEDDGRTAAQLARFEAAIAALRAARIALPPRHLAASGGLLQDGVAAYDGVRPGLAIYGLVPDELLPQDGFAAPGGAPVAGLRPVLELKARPVRVAEVPAGWGISYGPTFTTERPSRIATLPLGYGDGWPRSLSNRASALVRGRRVPLVGNVAMDAVMADVTDVEGPPVGVADEFVLIGRQGPDQITVPELAAARGTNSWEIVTDLRARLPRVYHAASVPWGLRTMAGHFGAMQGDGDADARSDAEAGPEAGGRRSMRP
jgi:alanine racemase